MFNVGDIVRRTKGDHNGMVVGEIAVVREVSHSGIRLMNKDGMSIFDRSTRSNSFTDSWHDEVNFELVTSVEASKIVLGGLYVRYDGKYVVTVHKVGSEFVKFHRVGEAFGCRTLTHKMFNEQYKQYEVKTETKVDQSAAVETKYDRTIIGKCGNKAVVDVYRVLDAFEVHNPMLSHLAKKALCAGLRGHKDYMEDLLDIQKAINEAIKLEEQR